MKTISFSWAGLKFLRFRIATGKKLALPAGQAGQMSRYPFLHGWLPNVKTSAHVGQADMGRRAVPCRLAQQERKFCG